MSRWICIFCFLLTFFYGEETGNVDGKYLGHKLPGNIPIVFAPGIISTKRDETSGFFSPDGKYLFFTRRNDIYWVSGDFFKNKLIMNILF